ncbi:MAG: hypothetical protein DMF50_12920 [Acidobacteria bacterium]|nr:MAG: hypothetical protein DMF50_12920 [Acidobacteriota bacterium]
MEDFDGDGFLDIMASSMGLRDQLHLFHNNGDGTFTERSEAAGLTGEVGGLNIVHADYDNDGHPDVLVLRGGWMQKGGVYPKSLLRNLGDGTFEDVTEKAGILTAHPTQTGSWADYDGDGWLDLFVGNEALPGDPHPASRSSGTSRAWCGVTSTTTAGPTCTSRSSTTTTSCTATTGRACRPGRAARIGASPT